MTGRSYENILTLAGVYLLFSVPVFVFRNREAVAAVYGDVLVPGRLLFAGLVGVGAVVFTGLFLARPGVERYVAFLRGPTDVPSVVVALSLVLAATAWWAVPELAFSVSERPDLELLLVAIIACQLPMVFFLTMLTAVGIAGEGVRRQ